MLREDRKGVCGGVFADVVYIGGNRRGSACGTKGKV